MFLATDKYFSSFEINSARTIYVDNALTLTWLTVFIFGVVAPCQEFLSQKRTNNDRSSFEDVNLLVFAVHNNMGKK